MEIFDVKNSYYCFVYEESDYSVLRIMKRDGFYTEIFFDTERIRMKILKATKKYILLATSNEREFIIVYTKNLKVLRIYTEDENIENIDLIKIKKLVKE